MRLVLLLLAMTLTVPGQAQERAFPSELKATGGQAEATFAGGCFWCTEADFEKLPGVVAAQSGYSGGTLADPTYEQVTGGRSGHTEAVRVVFDPAKVSYAQLVEFFWRTIDPTDAGGQFCDRGSSYRSAIFTHDETQRRTAEASKRALDASAQLKKAVVTEILPLTKFYPAETYHQDYYRNNRLRYRYYRNGCGRDRTLEALWGRGGG